MGDEEPRRSRIYSMRELNQNTAEVMRQILDSGRPGVITRHGRFIAMITPLSQDLIEAAVLGAVLGPGVGGPSEDGEDLLLDEQDVAASLGVEWPISPRRGSA